MTRLKTLFGFGSRMVFDGDGNDANNANADGGKTDGDNKAGGGGGGKKEEPANKPETHTIKVDGEDVVLTIDELKERAMHATGADKRFQEAATATKAAEKGIRVETLVKSISGEGTPSEADVRELAGLLEIDPGEFMTYLHDDKDTSQKSTPKATDIDFNDEFKKQMGASPAEVRAILEHSSSRHVNDARKEIRDISDLAVDKDEIIGKMIVGEGNKEVLAEVKNMVAEDVLRKIQDGKPFGAELVAASVQRVRSQMTKLGIPKKLNQQPIVMGLGPSEGFSSAIQADEPIKRIPADEDAGEKNLVSRYLQKVVKAVREQR